MAAYGGLLSLQNLMEPIKRVRNQMFVNEPLIKTLEDSVISLQVLLEKYSTGHLVDEVEKLEAKIIDAVLAAEDQIESHIVKDIRAQSKSTDFKDSFCQVLRDVIAVMDGIQKQALTSSLPMISDKQPLSHERPIDDQQQERRERNNMQPVKPMFDDSLIQKFILKLTKGNTNRQIIQITGIGGIGKTTIARHVVSHFPSNGHFKKEHMGWITISQEFNLHRVLIGLLDDFGVNYKNNLSEDSPASDLGIKLYKHLCGKRYLIVLDDIWSIEAWNELQIYLPDDKEGSRVIITSRESFFENVDSSDTHQMELLDAETSWELLQRNVFGGEDKCPNELKSIGRSIAKTCGGLPLLINVIGGVLKGSYDQQHWKNIEKDIRVHETSEVQDRLLTSYRYLPIHLKPCFLHLATFPEDHKISISELEKLWAAEGFLRVPKGKVMEDVARINVKALISKNLLYVDADMYDHARNAQYCKIHDLLRDLCLKEAMKHQFLYTTRVDRLDIQPGFSNQRRFALHGKRFQGVDHYSCILSSSFIRSFICPFAFKPQPPCDLELLRIWSVEESYSDELLSELLNVRYLDFGLISSEPTFRRSISDLWNLQRIRSGYKADTVLSCEIWEMSQLRHVNIMMFELEDPPAGKDKVLLENLQTLSRVVDFKCSTDVLERIPCLRRLKVSYEDPTLSAEYLKNLGRLENLESLACSFGHGFPREVTSELAFPNSIKKLTLQFDHFSWKGMGRKIGMLPQLEKLKLYYCGVCSKEEGENWDMDDDDDDDDDDAPGRQFPKLVYLKIFATKLKNWSMESGHLPNLEHLFLEQMKELVEIPPDIGNLEALRSITLRKCSQDAVKSALQIKDKKSSSGGNLVVTEE